MDYCKQCGTEISGANYCPNCGLPASEELMNQKEYAGILFGRNLRMDSLAELERMRAYFETKKAEYSECEKLARKILKRSAYSPTGSVVGALACLILGFLYKPFFVGLAIFVVFAIIRLVGNHRKLKEAKTRLRELNTELTEYYEAYGYCPIGLEYTKPEILFKVSEIIRQGRKETISGAVDRYEEDKHNKLVEELARQVANSSTKEVKSWKTPINEVETSEVYADAVFWLK